MAIKEFLLEVNDETKAIISDNFKMELTSAFTSPSVDDQGITFEDFDNKNKKAKIIETCVLHIDLRQSTKLNIEQSPLDLAKLYSCFIRGSIKCAEFYNGEVKNIAGDRLMILFSPDKCFENAVNAAILLHTFSSYILNRNFKNAQIQCGIGIDFGKMLVMKTGTIKHGSANSEYKSLVWLGPPANIASKLADLANKSFSRPVINIGKSYPGISGLDWSKKEIDDFFSGLEMTYSSPIIAQFKEPFIFSFFKSVAYTNYLAILMTDKVYNGFKLACPSDQSITNKWWKPRRINIGGYNGLIYEGAVYFIFAEKLV
jgi:hypothetical protein